MAAKRSPEMKKTSFYVWFLGAKESRGLRGEEYIGPVVKHLTSKEKDQEPIKVTLELSTKGMKIVQNLPSKRSSDNYRDNIKHFIPNSSITCAVQENRPNSDIVSVILLIYNPATTCPVHVHSYRCDSGETASLLLDQLNRLIQKPENQRKFLEIENRLQAKGLLQRNTSSAGSSRLGSDGRSLGRGSDSGAGSDKGSQLNPSDRIASMYDSLAAELREKLGSKEPLLLPPRDYDTMHRSKGNIFVGGGEERKGRSGLGGPGDSSGNSSGIGSQSPSPVHEPVFHHEDRTSSDEEWAEAEEARLDSQDSLLLVDSSWPVDRDMSPKQHLSSRFFPPKQRGSSPHKGKRDQDSSSPDCAKDRFKGAKQLFLSLERKKEKVPPRNQESPTRHVKDKDMKKGKESRDEAEARTSTNLEVKQLEGQARWSRYEKEVFGGRPRHAIPENNDSRWPVTDRDTGYASRYSRDKSRSRDFDESPQSGGKTNMFAKSGKKSSNEGRTSRRLSRFLSRETLESDGYDKIDEFDEPEPQRNKVKRNPSRTSLKLDMRKEEVAPDVPPGPRRGMLRREMTELDFKGYMQSYKGGTPDGGGFSRKYIPRQGPVWAGKERAMSPVRALSPVRRGGFVEEERCPAATKVIPAEFRREGRMSSHGAADRYPSLDLRNDKRKSLFECDLRKQYEPGQDYRRRSYHELSDIDKFDPPARNFQHSGRKVAPEPLGLPSRNPRNMQSYKQIPDPQRFPGLDRENSRISPMGPIPFKPSGGMKGRGPLPFEHGVNRSPFDHHPSNRPAMYRHSYAENPNSSNFPRVSPAPHNGRFGLASLKPY